MNAQLHPSFQAIVNTVLATPEITRGVELGLYANKLRQHDWHYEYSDDGHTYRKGREQREELQRLQPRLDPGHAIWNEHCPPQFRVFA